MKIEDLNKNEECDVESLQKMCELTGGKIRIVDPNSLKDELSGILSEKIIAYDVQVKCVLFPALKFRNQPIQEIKSKNNSKPTIIKNSSKPTIIIKPNINIKGDKTAVLSVNIPINNDNFTIDIVINNDMYNMIGKYI